VSRGTRPPAHSHRADVRDGYLRNHRANRWHPAAVAMAENMQVIEPNRGSAAHDACAGRGGTQVSADRRSGLGLGGLAVLACCGLKVLVLAGVALSLGSVGVVVRNVAIAVAGLAVAAAVVAYAIRRRRCDDACAAPDGSVTRPERGRATSGAPPP
jgi:hypothetical protein